MYEKIQNIAGAVVGCARQITQYRVGSGYGQKELCLLSACYWPPAVLDDKMSIHSSIPRKRDNCKSSASNIQSEAIHLTLGLKPSQNTVWDLNP